MERQEPGHGEHGFADLQQLVVAIAIGSVQSDRLTDSKAARREQADQRQVCSRPKSWA
jgi:hypothetical protein